MAFIRPDEREINFKLLLWGPPCSGKTTCIHYIRENLLAKNKNAIQPIASPDRTVFFDFLPLKLEKIKGLTAHFHIYTVPGQAPYKESRSILLRGVDGILVVLDAQIAKGEDNREALDELMMRLKDMGEDLSKLPMVFCYNKQDADSALDLGDMNTLYNPNGFKSFATVATKGVNVMDGFSSLLEQVIEQAKRNPL